MSSKLLVDRVKMIVYVLLITLSSTFCIYAQCISVQSYSKLSKRVLAAKDTTFLLHYWATWCKPCVKEIDQFDAVAKQYKDKKVKILLISLDSPQQLNSEVLPFLKSKNITSEVVLLSDTDMNVLVNKVHPSWSGAVPMSILFTSKKRKKTLFEGELSHSDILSKLNSISK